MLHCLYKEDFDIYLFKGNLGQQQQSKMNSTVHYCTVQRFIKLQMLLSTGAIFSCNLCPAWFHAFAGNLLGQFHWSCTPLDRPRLNKEEAILYSEICFSRYNITTGMCLAKLTHATLHVKLDNTFNIIHSAGIFQSPTTTIHCSMFSIWAATFKMVELGRCYNLQELQFIGAIFLREECCPNNQVEYTPHKWRYIKEEKVLYYDDIERQGGFQADRIFCNIVTSSVIIPFACSVQHQEDFQFLPNGLGCWMISTHDVIWKAKALGIIHSRAARSQWIYNSVQTFGSHQVTELSVNYPFKRGTITMELSLLDVFGRSLQLINRLFFPRMIQQENRLHSLFMEKCNNFKVLLFHKWFLTYAMSSNLENYVTQAYSSLGQLINGCSTVIQEGFSRPFADTYYTIQVQNLSKKVQPRRWSISSMLVEHKVLLLPVVLKVRPSHFQWNFVRFNKCKVGGLRRSPPFKRKCKKKVKPSSKFRSKFLGHFISIYVTLSQVFRLKVTIFFLIFASSFYLRIVRL